MFNFKDDSPRLKHEFNEVIDPRLRGVLLGLAYYVYYTFQVKIVFTCFVRTPDENKRAGGRSDSSHLDRRAADIRTLGLTDIVCEKMLEYVKRVWGVNVHIIRHTGTADHIHVNINRHFVTPPTQG